MTGGPGWGYGAPLATALGILSLLTGPPSPLSSFLFAAGAAGLVPLTGFFFLRQPALCTGVAVAGAAS